ncbi:Serine/threonine-protein kinase PINK1, mitochondrial [Eufriesea mexicana]|uniref:serine/threonine-protein kinase PINK1, mitochondrial n=1 Tax=Eufriesea mexicana TaxID=516756 RepID=UPI00083C866B|nr:PREDICTED: serine/threonine-protein kinase PINK1, mitochondrial [Eufriesea mexicana]XP_017754476.1 PREDICTED: serine/threonine-protein kinase PINK1, mitochondrial [Eufriesea mexicana]XP_017754477.1 PREDICTED: serine/threonine-protein kinase PINK1, mitochondrial [Eufriesea mexicana]OAD58846.1 Serine/threonine-protein kinase PINK1, mitochondrial [Eufriesea mexicana]
MSIRTVVHRYLQNVRALLHSFRNTECFYSNYHPRNYHDKIHVAQVGKSQGCLPQGNSNVSGTGKRLGYLGAHTRQIFVDNILKRVTNSLAADLRRRTASKLVFGGDSAPFFALVGVSLASGTGILTKDDELEGVCWEIREAVSKVQWNAPQNDKNYETLDNEEKIITLKDFIIGPVIAKGCSAVVYAARFNSSFNDEPNKKGQINIDDKTKDITAFPLALKMMFNYDTESNALSILRSMYRETVPARKYLKNEELAEWELKMAERKAKLPPHPNIVAVYYVFTDKVPALPGSWGMYPDALPTRINPHGSGRNMSLFLLMKRYDITLKQYLSDHHLSTRESILLLAQLLEGVTHLNAHGIAHRDLKSDNILLDLSEVADNCPSLVITDFGCCLADKRYGLYLPYNTHDVDKGGNAALMAPEVITAEPGSFTSINYTKADLWTVGTIAYEIFGMKNPFHNNKEGIFFKNYNYKEEDLLPLPNHVPSIISALVKNLLSRNLNKRLDTETAATIIQLHLWAPSVWLQSEWKLPSSNEIMQWLLCLTTKILCEGQNNMLPEVLPNENAQEYEKRNSYNRLLSTKSCGRRTMPEYQLIASFLGRVTLGNIRTALKWIQQNI